MPSRSGPDEATARFVERLALMLTDAGIPRMPSRVFSHLLTTGSGKATATELGESLHVSPAAISGAVRYLDQVGLVRRARDPGERRDHYEVTDDLWFEVYSNRDKQFEAFQNVFSEGIDAVGPDTPAGHRLELTRRFFAYLAKEMPLLMDRFREQEGRSKE